MGEKNENIKISKAAFKEWLEKLQQESWQLELLISGFALFAILEARVLVDGLETYRELNRGDGARSLSVFFSAIITILKTGWRIFFFNLLIHVVTRGLWIGAIGLRYVSSEIEYDSLNYADNFTRFLKRRVGDFDDYIEKLERFSSVLFAYTFLLFFVFLSLMLFFAQFIIIVGLIGPKNPMLISLASLFFVFIGMLAFVDFVTMGGIKRIKERSISRIYFVFYRLFSILSFSFLYRPLLYNFWDEKYTRRLFFISLPYMLAIIMLPNLEMDATPFFPLHKHTDIHSRSLTEPMAFSSQYYDDERAMVYEQRSIFASQKKMLIKRISLPSIELEGNYGWFFLRSVPSDKKLLEQEANFTPYKKSGLVFRNMRTHLTDSLYQKIEQQQSDALLKVREARKAMSKQVRANEIVSPVKGARLVDGAYELDKVYWRGLSDSINEIWDARLEAFEQEKLQTLNRTLLDFAQVHIDGVPFNDSCSCKFYIHPNAGERGLRCYFPMQSLSEGEHLIHLERKFYEEEAAEDFEINDYYVPFYKLN